jgi:hypothetical protein
MRTTISIDERLLALLKHRAAESGSSVSRLVEQAIRLFLRTAPASRQEERFELVTFGHGGRFSRQPIDKTSALIEADDEARYTRR